MSGLYGKRILTAASAWVQINAAAFTSNVTVNIRAANSTGNSVKYWLAIGTSAPTGLTIQDSFFTPGISIMANFMYEDTGIPISAGENIYALCETANAVTVHVRGIEI